MMKVDEGNLIWFDKRLLPPASAEMGVISDAHYALGSVPGATEFPSRGRQSARLGVALDLLRALSPDWFVHLGDLTQEPPESPQFERARSEAAECFEQRGICPIWVPGNHDIGDKPDPVTAARAVEEAFISAFEAFHGPTWQAIECGGVEWIFLNSQILGTGSAREAEQCEWLEERLAVRSGGRTAIFLHLPLFTHDAAESATGHYDNLPIGPRRWLLDLCERHRVELVISGHIHHRSRHRVAGTTVMTCASPAFSRPGFAAAFGTSAPPERGRDDTPKLGIHLFRVRDEGIDCHFVRTGGAESTASVMPVGVIPVLTPMARDLRDPRLVVSLEQPLTSETVLPLAWPYAIRSKFRNDYPLLLLEELAPAAVRVPACDLDDPIQREALSWLRRMGTRVQAVTLWCPETEDRPLEVDWPVDLIEVQIPGRIPTADVLGRVRRWLGGWAGEVRLAPLFPREPVPGKQHHRFRHAWRALEGPEVEAVLGEVGWRPESLLFLADEIDRVECLAAGRADFLHSLGAADPGVDANDALGALAAVFRHPGSQLLITPFRDLDRTMDAANGLLDTLCNPRDTFHVMKYAHAFLAMGRPSSPDPARPVLDLLRGCWTDVPEIFL